MSDVDHRWWELTVPPVVVFAAAGLIQRLSVRRNPWTRTRALAALGVAAGSGALGASALTGFRRAATTVSPHAPQRSSALVTDGAHGITRNPMYVALAGGLLTHALALGSVRALLPLAGFVAALDVAQIRPEERVLAHRFGTAYADYCRRVPRWLGPVRPGVR